jgi:hypothetical protein
MTPEEFKQLLLTDSLETILTDVLLSDVAKHVSTNQSELIRQSLSAKFNVPIDSINLIIVGSAKLGFSISEKKNKIDNSVLPRYRSFSPQSDIDLAIICNPIFEAIWNELSKYSSSVPYSPWQSKRCGDYLVCGWMRPDHFPQRVRLRKCDDWWDTFRYLSSRQVLGRRRIRGGLFFNLEQLKNYQSKALLECINIEKLK